MLIRGDIVRRARSGSRTIHVARSTATPTTDVPVIAIHGGPGFTSMTLESGMEALAEHVGVTLFDLPGCGRSSRHPGSGYPLDDYLDDLDAVVNDTTTAQVVLLAHGWGAILATAFASRSALVAGLVLVNPLRVLDESGQDSAAQHRRIDAVDPTLVAQFHALKGTIEQGRAGDPSGWDTFDRSTWPRAMFATQFAGAVPARWSVAMDGAALGYESYDAYKGVALTDPSSAWARFDLAEWAGQVRVPVLLVASDDDANYVALPDRHAIPLAAAFTTSRLALMRGVGHFPFAEAPTAFAALVAPWIGGLRHD